MQTLTRDTLKARPSRLLSAGRNRTKADVSLIELGPEKVVLKDFRGRGFVVRNTIGRFSVSRECRALGRLAGVPGIPALLGRIDAHAVAWAWVEGRPLPQLKARSLPSAFFDALETLLAAVHGRGVAVGDLHHRNVIVSAPTGAPSLIDFSLAVARPASRWNLPGRWLFEKAAELDRVAADRIRLRYQQPAASAAGPGRGGGGADRSGAGASSPIETPSWYGWGRALKRLSRRIRGKA
jgi:predicted Ser/Thr protein kinase